METARAQTTRTCDDQISPLSKCWSPPVDDFHADGTKGCQMTKALANRGLGLYAEGWSRG